MLKGTLDDFTLADIFRLTSMAKKTGRVEIVRTAGSGKVFFRDGDVYYAECSLNRVPLGQKLIRAGALTENQLNKALDLHAETGVRVGEILVDNGFCTVEQIETALQGQIESAIFDLLRWDTGEFAWEPDVIADVEVQISVSVENLIMEASRRLDELAVIQRKIRSMDAVPRMAPKPPEGAAEINITPEEWRVLVLVDGSRTVADIADMTGLDEFNSMRMIYGLVSAGLVDVPQEEETSRMRVVESARFDDVEPEPEPVAQVQPEPEPAAAFEPEPEPVAPAEPEPQAAVDFEPAPSADLLPEPEPAPAEEPQPSAEASFDQTPVADWPADAAARESDFEAVAEEPVEDAGPTPVWEPETSIEAEVAGATEEAEPLVEEFVAMAEETADSADMPEVGVDADSWFSDESLGGFDTPQPGELSMQMPSEASLDDLLSDAPAEPVAEEPYADDVVIDQPAQDAASFDALLDDVEPAGRPAAEPPRMPSFDELPEPAPEPQAEEMRPPEPPPAPQQPSRVDRAAVVRELAGLFDDERPRPKAMETTRPAQPGDKEADQRKRVEDDDQVNKGLISRLIDGVKGL